DVGGRQDQRDAWKAARAARIDGELRMRMRRAQHQRVHGRLGRKVVGVAPLATDERVILLAQHALTDAEFDGSSHPYLRFPDADFPSYCSGLRRSANALCALSALDQELQPPCPEQADDQSGIDQRTDTDQKYQRDLVVKCNA